MVKTRHFFKWVSTSSSILFIWASQSCFCLFWSLSMPYDFNNMISNTHSNNQCAGDFCLKVQFVVLPFTGCFRIVIPVMCNIWRGNFFVCLPVSWNFSNVTWAAASLGTMIYYKERYTVQGEFAFTAKNSWKYLCRATVWKIVVIEYLVRNLTRKLNFKAWHKREHE